MIVLTVVKAGYYNGNPDYVYNSAVDTVLNTYHYELFTRDFENTLHELNKKGK